MARRLTDNLKHGVSSGRFALNLDGEDAKQQDLHGCTGSIPACAEDNHACNRAAPDGGDKYSSLSCAHGHNFAKGKTHVTIASSLAGSTGPCKEATNRADSPEWSRHAVLVGNVAGL